MDLSTLQSRISTAYIPPHRTQLHPRMHSFAAPFSKPLPSSHPPTNLKWCSLAAALLAFLFLLYLFSLARGVHLSSRFSDPKPNGHGLVIHIGRAVTRARVFEFLNDGRVVPLADGRGVESMTVRSGLAEFAADAENAGNSLLGLLGFAKERIPNAEWKDTKVRLVATGQLGTDARDSILKSCRQVLRSSGFRFKDEWASTITGEEEGIYTWVAVNYALDNLGSDPQETKGIVEISGTSLQITFASTKPPPMEFSHSIKVAGVTYTLYSRSVVQFGQDAVWELLHQQHNSGVVKPSSASTGSILNPCIPKGHKKASAEAIALDITVEQHQESHPAGNFSACRSEAFALLQKSQEIGLWE